MNGVQKVPTGNTSSAVVLDLTLNGGTFPSKEGELPEITLDPIGTFVKQEMCSCGGSDDNPYP